LILLWESKETNNPKKDSLNLIFFTWIVILPSFEFLFLCLMLKKITNLRREKILKIIIKNGYKRLDGKIW
jgi:hypothetical protein